MKLSLDKIQFESRNELDKLINMTEQYLSDHPEDDDSTKEQFLYLITDLWYMW